VGETLVIGADIEVEVLESGTSQVKLGIRAPRSVGVVRKEIQTVSQQNQAAAHPIPVQFLKQFKNSSLKPIRPV
jgi:carbon storage regulator